jgi:hypothetical protein
MKDKYVIHIFFIFVILCMTIIDFFYCEITYAQLIKIPSNDNLLLKMSDNEVRLLNIFVSNFGEVEYGYQNYENNTRCFSDFDDDVMIEFGVRHSYANNMNSLKSTDNPHLYLVPKKLVENAVERYFGKKITNHRSVKNDKYPALWRLDYDNGYYDIAVGNSQPFLWSNVTEFYDNGDGTFKAYVDNYFSFYYFYRDENTVYNRKENWNNDSCPETNHSGCYSLESSWIATIVPYTYNGKNTYKLVAMECNSNKSFSKNN